MRKVDDGKRKEKKEKQAGAELCQAQLKLILIGAGLTDQN